MAISTSANRGVSEDGYQLDTRSRILQAALDVFAARGFEAATIREITSRVGLSHGLVKYHFKSKDALWRNAIQFMFSRVIPASRLTEDEAASLSPRELFEAELRKTVQYYAKHPEHLRIFMHESLNEGERLFWIIDNFRKNLIDQSIERNRVHIESRVLKDVDPLHLYYAMMGAIQMIFILAPEVRRLQGVDPATPKEIDRHIAAIIKLVLR
jgi:AcrR family transcriptional regulator